MIQVLPGDPARSKKDPGSWPADRGSAPIRKAAPLKYDHFNRAYQSNAAILAELRYNNYQKYKFARRITAALARSLPVALYKAAMVEVKFRTILKRLTPG